MPSCTATSLLMFLVVLLSHHCCHGSASWYVFTSGPSALFQSCSPYSSWTWSCSAATCHQKIFSSNSATCSATTQLSASRFGFYYYRSSQYQMMTAFGISFTFEGSSFSSLNSANVTIQQLNDRNVVINTTVVQPSATTGSTTTASPSCIVVISSSCKTLQFTMYAPPGVQINSIPSQFTFTSADAATIKPTCSPTTSILPNFARTSTTVSASTSSASSNSISDSCIVSSEMSSTSSRTQSQTNESPSLSEEHSPSSSTVVDTTSSASLTIRSLNSSSTSPSPTLSNQEVHASGTASSELVTTLRPSTRLTTTPRTVSPTSSLHAPPPPAALVTDPPIVAATAALAVSVNAATAVLAASLAGGALMQASLGAAHCAKSSSSTQSSNVVGGTISPTMYLVSPFYGVGGYATVFGNVGLVLLSVAVHLGMILLGQRLSSKHLGDTGEVVEGLSWYRFPNVSIEIAVYAVQGVTLGGWGLLWNVINPDTPDDDEEGV